MGVQIIRAAALIQALLGNIGRPGGGGLALRGHSSIQGSTDIPTLYNMLPSYLPQPQDGKAHETFEEFLRAKRSRPAGGTTSRNMRSACCAPGTATMRPATTSGAISGCRASSATSGNRR